jgi:hypothetical protein
LIHRLGDDSLILLIENNIFSFSESKMEMIHVVPSRDPISPSTVFFNSFFFEWEYSLNSGLLAYKACFLNHTSSPFCSGYFGDGDLINCFPGLTLNQDSPDLSLPNS